MLDVGDIALMKRDTGRRLRTGDVEVERGDLVDLAVGKQRCCDRRTNTACSTRDNRQSRHGGDVSWAGWRQSERGCSVGAGAAELGKDLGAVGGGHDA